MFINNYTYDRKNKKVAKYKVFLTSLVTSNKYQITITPSTIMLQCLIKKLLHTYKIIEDNIKINVFQDIFFNTTCSQAIQFAL
jgi:hypothetical protein